MPTRDTRGLAKQARIDRVVEELGQLNDRRLLANARDDLVELEAIAQAYQARGMVRMAGELRTAIAVRRREKRVEKSERRKEYSATHLRKRTLEEDFMANLLDMGKPSSILPLIDSVHLCAIAKCRNKPAVMLCWAHWEPVTLCRKHDEMRKAKRTK